VGQFCFFHVRQTCQLLTIGCVLVVSSPQILSAPLLAFLKKGGVVKAVSPWYCVAWNTLFSVRSNFQEKDLCCLSLSSFSCRISSFCRLDPRELGSSFVRVCFKRCLCAPSMLKGPDGKYTVAMPCVVTAWTGPMDVSQSSGCSKIRTAPISGGFFF